MFLHSPDQRPGPEPRTGPTILPVCTCLDLSEPLSLCMNFNNSFHLYLYTVSISQSPLIFAKFLLAEWANLQKQVAEQFIQWKSLFPHNGPLAKVSTYDKYFLAK